MKTHVFVFAITLFLGLIGSSVNGQISATGKAKLTAAPAEFLRMEMSIEAQGKDFKAALEALADKKKKAKIRLEKLAADESSIKFGEAQSSGGDSATQMQQMAERYGDDPRMEKMLKMKPPVKLSVDLTVDWPLTGEGDELLMACDELKAKITAADIGLVKEKLKLTPQQEELAAEMEEMMEQTNHYYGGEEEVTPGTPAFQYLRVITPEQHDKLLGDAYGDAKTQAERIAKATGLTLGELKSLSVGGVDNSENYGYGYQQTDESSTTDESGTIFQAGTSPTSIAYEVKVRLVFELKAKP